MIDEHTKFDYNIITRNNNAPMTIAELNSCGATRWQLVQIISRENQLDYIFIRVRRKYE